MNKTDLISVVAESADISKASATRAVDATFKAIMDSLAKDDAVTLVGFGTFLVKHRKSRQGINLQTKEPITIPAAKVPGFKAGKSLKEAVK